jgi:CRISPR system Cascade subunit CasD
MTRFLVFQLYAPLAAMGDITVGERRTSWPRPARSAVFGLLAAALGVEREDAEAHSALEAGYGFGIATLATGRPLRDFHTVQTVPAKGIREIGRTTRRTEVAWLDRNPDVNPIVSLRDYRTDAFFVVALLPQENVRWSLDELGEALRRPAFTLYFGRRACPLALPLAPSVEEAADMIAAVAAYLAGLKTRNGDAAAVLGLDRPSRWTVPEGPSSLAVDEDVPLPSANWPHRVEERRDAVRSRMPPRRFALRRERILMPSPETEP